MSLFELGVEDSIVLNVGDSFDSASSVFGDTGDLLSVELRIVN